MRPDVPTLTDPQIAARVRNPVDAYVFARLEREYEDLDKAIVRLESGIEHGSSAELEQKKQQRVTLKDELYALLKA